MPMMEFSEELMLQVITIQFGRIRAKPTRPPRLALSHVVTSFWVAYKASQQCLKAESFGSR